MTAPVPTPRTDAAGYDTIFAVARQLEREAIALREQLASERDAREKCERDADRYRWLREDLATERGEPWAITRYKPGDKRNTDDGTCPLRGEELDAAIDAALQGAKHE